MKNTSIARTHRLYRKLVGELLAQSIIMALVVNSVVVAFGILFFAMDLANGSPWYQALGVGLGSLIIGAFVALTADSQTLSACARWRINIEQVTAIRSKYAVIPKRHRHPGLDELERKEIVQQESARNWNIACVLFFCVISSTAGVLFWHRLFSAMPTVQAWIFSSLFSLLISFTLVSGELFKRQNNDVIRESIAGDPFANDAMMEDMNESVAMVIAEKCVKRVSELTHSSITQIAIDEYAMSELDRKLAGGKGRIPLRIQQEKEEKLKEDEKDQEKLTSQLRLIQGGKGSVEPVTVTIAGNSNKERVLDAKRKYPNASSRDIATRLGLSQSTVAQHLRQERLSEQA